MNLPAIAAAAGLAGWTPVSMPIPRTVPVRGAAAQEPVVVASPSGAVTPWGGMISGLLSARVVAVGEKHDEASHHRVQAEVLAALADLDPNVAVGLEMVSQDQQEALDDFMSGKTDEARFAAFWRTAWGYDYALYKPIFDAARARRLKMYGLNAPISLVVAVAKRGLAGLSAEERARLPASIEESSDPRYREFVRSSLEDHNPSSKGMSATARMFDGYKLPADATAQIFDGKKLSPEAAARLIEAQAVWNETMGAKAAELAASSRVVVIAGQGHMFWKAGVPESAARRGAGATAVVIPYPLDGERASVPDQLERLRDPASGELSLADDFVLIP